MTFAAPIKIGSTQRFSAYTLPSSVQNLESQNRNNPLIGQVDLGVLGLVRLVSDRSRKTSDW